MPESLRIAMLIIGSALVVLAVFAPTRTTRTETLSTGGSSGVTVTLVWEYSDDKLVSVEVIGGGGPAR